MNGEYDPGEVTEREKKLIELIRCTESGFIRVAVEEGEPIQVEEMRTFLEL